MNQTSACVFVSTALAIASVAPAAADAVTPASGGPVFGYLDPVSRIFTAAPDEDPAINQNALRTPVPPIVVSGTLNVTVNISFGPTAPAGTTAQASVSVQTTPSPSAYPAYSSGFDATAVAVVTGSTGVATITLPYTMTVSSMNDPVSLYLTIYASNGGSSNSTQTFALPPNGHVSNVTFNQTF